MTQMPLHCGPMPAPIQLRGALALTFAATAVAALAVSAPACSSNDAVTPTGAADAGACTGPDFAGAPFGIHCNAIVDSDGRSVLLNGVNARVRGLFDVTFADGRVPLEEIPDFTEADAARMRSLGYDTLRLPLSWSGLEPTEDGGFNAAYMTRLAEVVDHCKKAGIFVFFSMHQDGYSKEIGQDGAPLWAIKPPPTKLLEGPLVDLSERILSDQVGNAFGTFFGDSADGTYLRKRFGAMAAHVIGAFADNGRCDWRRSLQRARRPRGADHLVLPRDPAGIARRCAEEALSLRAVGLSQFEGLGANWHGQPRRRNGLRAARLHGSLRRERGAPRLPHARRSHAVERERPRRGRRLAGAARHRRVRLLTVRRELRVLHPRAARPPREPTHVIDDVALERAERRVVGVLRVRRGDRLVGRARQRHRGPRPACAPSACPAASRRSATTSTRACSR